MHVIIQNQEHARIEAEIILNKNPVSIDCIVDRESFKTYGTDYFNCLVELRKIFEARNWLLLCNGCRYDVYPSGMSRSMGLGKKAYKMELGKQAKMEDLLNIFDYAELDKISSVEKQKDNFNKWIESVINL
jgi:hypothetical protein